MIDWHYYLLSAIFLKLFTVWDDRSIMIVSLIACSINELVKIKTTNNSLRSTKTEELK